MPQDPLLDKIDRKILITLQSDGRISNQRLSEDVGLSPSACLARVRRLEDVGIITGYKAQLNPDALGPSIILYAEISLGDHSSQTFTRLIAALLVMPEVIEAYQVTGRYDVLARFHVRDMAHWGDLSDALIDGPFTIETIKTMISMRKLKGWSGLPFENEHAT
jgi:Lrp/AsnC family leucine-responsive transcriptional regulator